MKFHLATADGNMFTAIGDSYVRVGTTEYRDNIAVTADKVIRAWAPDGFAALTAAHFAGLVSLKPEIMILGTGRRIAFPHPSLTRPLTEAGIGVEVMDTAAACRTFNILSSEGRDVLAALIIEA